MNSLEGGVTISSFTSLRKVSNTRTGGFQNSGEHGCIMFCDCIMFYHRPLFPQDKWGTEMSTED